MSTNPSSSSALTKFLPIGVIAVVILVVLYFFMSGGSKAPAPTAAAPGAANPAANAPTAAAPTSDALPELTPQQLLKEGGNAMRENRLVAPPGNNAFEYYERLLEKEPNNQTAKDALRETFPIVIGVPEQDINAGNLDEAARVITLLAKADPNNYTLTILRSKLDAKKKQTEREQALATAATTAAAAKQAAAAAANSSAPAPAAAAPPPAAAPAANNASANTAASAAANNETASAARPAPARTAAPAEAPPAAAETHAAEIVKTTPPDYPPDAVRKRQEGWVEVEFTVTPDGSVANPTVVNANPARVFNAAALSAVGRWTFKPRMENGKAVEEKIRRRIEFKF
jgi:protein TonB